MPEVSEVGNKISKADYKKVVPDLRVGLINAQHDLRHADFPCHHLDRREMTGRGPIRWSTGQRVGGHQVRRDQVFADPIRGEEMERPAAVAAVAIAAGQGSQRHLRRYWLMRAVGARRGNR